ncbi:MAG: hypothetical protein HONBIEJF_02512 [Fimbriimonadaceae bacterium]|nr:hypothetical protein [Fimbriimonadaceae bacterium]
MKYVCLGFMDETLWDQIGEQRRNEMIDACMDYDEANVRSGILIGGQGLLPSANAATVRLRDGRASVTDGPFAETKEQIGGIQILEATDLNHAIQIMSNHPSVAFGSIWEIRPVFDLTEMQSASAERRGSKLAEEATIVQA